MPPKAKKIAAPIDRPLSRAYLREFTGWSTAYPPGLSDPTSLRIMENVQINRDGSCRIRPGLRYLSYLDPPEDSIPGTGMDQPLIGSHEAFFLNDGTKAYLFAVREDDGTVGFRVLSLAETGAVVLGLDDVPFALPQTEAVLNFSEATTYVRYLQIDNKIFALSNAGETVRLFVVGVEKEARRLSAIERPEWHVNDKLVVVKPDGSWITGGAITSQRTNMANVPSFEHGIGSVTADAFTDITTSTTVAKNGTYSLRQTTKPQRTNIMRRPLHDVPGNGVTGWAESSGAVSVLASGSSARVTSGGGAVGTFFYARGPDVPVVAGQVYRIALDKLNLVNTDQIYTMHRFYNSGGAEVGTQQFRDLSTATGRNSSSIITAPAGAVTMSVYVRGRKSAAATARFDFNDVLICKDGESTAMFSGDSGPGYYWTGAGNASTSVYQPDHDVLAWHKSGGVVPGEQYAAKVSVRAGTTGRNFTLKLQFLDFANNQTGVVSSTPDADVNSGWETHEVTMVAPSGSVSYQLHTVFADVARGEYHYVDEVIVEKGATTGTYFTGDTADSGSVQRSWTGTPGNSPSTETTYSSPTTIPTAETATTNTLIHSTAANNDYSFGYFYTFENEVGESAASQVTVIKAQRSWATWKWEANSATGEPNGTPVSDPTVASDQLVAYMPEDVYDSAKAQGARKWNLYMLTWSDEDSVPVEGLLLGSAPITSSGTYGAEGWIRHTPENNDTGFSAPLPSTANRYNYSAPSSASQGLVAADRMILVGDPNAQAVIRWSSNQQGEYSNFTASKGGGYKTLTSGNLFTPVAVKLWQNPQSVDTLTILCTGVDGMNTSYYMAPASVAQQSEQVTVMGFEETTASPGTTSPYGVEVMNNALWHPIDEMLMKSTASNYNISHKSMTDQIQDRWAAIANKHRIVSCQHDNRLYYIVDNPRGEAVEDGCMGNEIWVFDIASEKGTWSRWLIQGASLRRIEVSGKIYISVVRPDGLFYLDPDYDGDDWVDVDDGRLVKKEYIPWYLETNTQGANRAHDAWAHLRQLQVTLGNFSGRMSYGIKSWDTNGRAVSLVKQTKDLNPPDEVEYLPYDIDDYLRVARDLREWFFHAGSVLDENGQVERSFGQINVVQYRYTPVSVNVGYEYGSIETFEYTRAVVNTGEELTTNGVPVPMIDVRRP